jgi:hypothetical protein
MARRIDLLKKQALELGLTFNANATVAYLEALITEAGNTPVTGDEQEEVKEVKEVKELKETDTHYVGKTSTKDNAKVKQVDKSKFYAKMLVEITSKDPAEQSLPSDYFAVRNRKCQIARIVKFNTPILLEVALINLIKNTIMLQHIPEVDRLGEPTGNHRVGKTYKYSVSFI